MWSSTVVGEEITKAWTDRELDLRDLLEPNLSMSLATDFTF